MTKRSVSSRPNKCPTKMEQESIEPRYNDTWEKNINNWSTDIESQNYDSEENIVTFNESTSLKEPINWSLDYDKNKNCNTSNLSLSIHTNSFIWTNSTINSQLLDAVNFKDDQSYDSNIDEEKNTMRNNRTTSIGQ